MNDNPDPHQKKFKEILERKLQQPEPAQSPVDPASVSAVDRTKLSPNELLNAPRR